MGRISLPQSTVINPIAFFEEACETDLFGRLRDEYRIEMENLKEQNLSNFSDFDFSNLIYKESISVRNTISEHENNQTTHERFEEKTVEIKHSYNEYFDNLIKEEIKKSKRLIHSFLYDAHSPDQALIRVRLIRSELLGLRKQFITHENSLMIIPNIENLLDYLLIFKHDTIMRNDPWPGSVPEVTDLKEKKKRVISSANLSKLITELTNLENTESADSTPFINGDTGQKEFQAAVYSVLGEGYDYSGSEITTTWAKEPVAYIIKCLKDHFHSFEIEKFVGLQMLTTPKGKFKNAANVSTAASKFSKKNSLLKQEIDRLFDKYSKEIE